MNIVEVLEKNCKAEFNRIAVVNYLKFYAPKFYTAFQCVLM